MFANCIAKSFRKVINYYAYNWSGNSVDSLSERYLTNFSE